MSTERGSILLPLLTAAVLVAGAAWAGSPRAFQVLVFAAMIAGLWGTGSRLARWLVPGWSLLSRWVASFTFAVAVAVVPATWMGHFGVMWPGVFLAWTAGVYLLSRFLPVRDPETETSRAAIDSIAPAPSRWDRIETALLVSAAAAIAMVGLADMFRLRFAPAGPYGFDDISYHLAAVATWLRHGDLRMMRFSVGDASTPFYPVLGEVSSWVLFAPFRDSDAVARWTQIPFGLFSVLAVAAISRRLGLSPRLSALAAILFASLHRVIPMLALSAGNDHSASFFTLAAVDGGLALARRPRPGGAVATGAALGLLLATKYIGVLYAPVVLLVLGLAWLLERRDPGSEARVPARAPAEIAGLAGLLAAVLAVTAGYTYLRNAVTTGNPIFPAPLSLFGVDVFPGWESARISQRDTSPEFRINVLRFLTLRRDLFGPFFPFTMLPAALAAPLVSLWRRKWVATLVFTLPTLFFLEFLFLMHDHRDMRYFVPAIALAAVAFAWLIDRIGPRTVPFRILLLALVTYQAARRLDMSDAREVLLTLALFGLGTLVAREARRRSGQAPSRPRRWAAASAVVIAVIAVIAAVPLGWLVDVYQETKLTERPAAFAMDALAGPGGAKIAYVGLNQPYLFFGRRIQNDVQIVPRNWDLDAQYYRWGSPVTDPFAFTTYRRWRRILDRLGIQWIVVVRTPWEDPERAWIGQRKGDFRLAWEDMGTEIWKVLPKSSRSAPGYNPRDAKPANPANPAKYRR
ncbi:MAG TPA: phospholipid carrier-dependent glycosyltransferase [Thermoanaerobaculia bacterium]|jgi:hypothetical protein|nr:phospholipid carrier-dependent glycosyltransferase [Thermoanaerobaculia bacterium]